MSNTITTRVGDAEVSVITDGVSSFGSELFPGSDPSHIAELLAAAGEDAVRTNFNAVLIRTSGRTVLADAGPRDLFGPTCGNLQAGLAEIGVAPDEVDTLFATHLHPDHVAGALTPEGAAAFPNAELVLLASERVFWAGEIAGANAMVKDWQALARSVLGAYGDRLRPIDGEAEIAPGMSAMPLPGHTPGHSGYRVQSGTETLIHVGDIMHAPHIQAADPEVSIVFDIDPDTARTTRKRLLDQLASDRTLVTGGHLLAPALQRVERHRGGYRMAGAEGGR